MDWPCQQRDWSKEVPKPKRKCSVVLLIGAPASGKTTLGAKLASWAGYVLFDIGTHMRKHMPPEGSEADVEAFAMRAVDHVLATETKVILSGYPKWQQGLDHLKRCQANIVLALHLTPVDPKVLWERSARRHLSGERPEDHESHFQNRLDAFNTNVGAILDQINLSSMCTVCDVNPMLDAATVEQSAKESWAFCMADLDPLQAIELLTLPDGSPKTDRAGEQSSASLISEATDLFGELKSVSEMQAAGKLSRNDARGRSPLRLEGKVVSNRVDPDEADIELSVCLLSGEERLLVFMPPRSTVQALKASLVEAGETDFDLELSFMGQSLSNTDVLSKFNGFENGSVIHMMRKEKPPPPVYVSRSNFGVCFTADSVVRVCENNAEVERCFPEVRVGDMVRTARGKYAGVYRRVQRVWKHEIHHGTSATYELAPGCRLTVGHPVLLNNEWRRPEDICESVESFESEVYQLEVEGHVDTVLAGRGNGVVCALLGRYCGEDFGWNMFTRKTVLCDERPCAKCAIAVNPHITFEHTKITKSMFDARYPAY